MLKEVVFEFDLALACDLLHVRVSWATTTARIPAGIYNHLKQSGKRKKGKRLADADN